MRVEDTDIAWAAGLFDGEGCFSMTIAKTRGGSRKHHMARMFVTNTDIRCLYRMQQIFGGSVSLASRRKSPKHKQAWVWVLCNKTIADVAKSMLRYSVIKRAQLELAISFYSTMKKNGTRGMGRGVVYSESDVRERDEIVSKLRVVNMRGVA